MDEKSIKQYAIEYVEEYKNKQSEDIGNARRLAKYPMIVFFLGDDLEECHKKCEDTMNDLWLNSDNIFLVDITNSDNIEDIIIQTLEAFSKVDQAITGVNLSLVFKSTSNFSSKISAVISAVSRNMEFIVGDSSVNYYIYSIVEESLSERGARSLSQHLENIESVRRENSEKNIYSILVGDKYNSNRAPVASELANEAVASCMILTNNNETGGFTDTNYFSARPAESHTLVGFSQADTPLKTIYIIGFDIFTDIVIDYYKEKHLEIENFSFDIKKDILAQYQKNMNSLLVRLVDNSKYLIRKNVLPDGQYSFDTINASYGETLEKYYIINKGMDKNTASLSVDEIKVAFNAVLFKFFIDLGLDSALNHLEEIYTEERKKMEETQNTSYEQRAYGYVADAPGAAVKDIIGQMVKSDIQDMEKECRTIILSLIEKKETILHYLDQTFTSIQRVTERCKTEEASKDVNVKTAANRIKYEEIMLAKRDTIRKRIQTGEFRFFDGGIDGFENLIFGIYNDKIAQTFLFEDVRTYRVEVNNLKQNDLESWVRRQKDIADLTLNVISAAKLPKYVFLSDISTAPGNNEALISKLITDENTPIVPVAGITVFRTFNFRLLDDKSELFAIHQLNKNGG